MPLGEMTEDQILVLESRLLDLVPATGSIGNTALLRTLAAEGWSEDRYWTVRQRLMDRGALVTGRGRGGSVKRGGARLVPAVTSMRVEAVVPAGPLSFGADVVELPLASGGRVLALIQGKPTASDIANLQSLLLARYFDVESDLDSDELAEGVAAEPFAKPSSRGSSDSEDQDSLELEDGPDDELTHPAPTLAPEMRASRNEQVEDLVTRIIQSIDPRKNGARAQAVIVSRYGLGVEAEQTLDAVGRKYDITRERVRQIEARALGRLSRSSLRNQAKDVLASWIRQEVGPTLATGALLTSRQIETLKDDGTVVDGWIKLALDVAFPTPGPQKLVSQLAALADITLHRYAPFGVPCWVSEHHRADSVFPIVEAWLEELETSSQALPLPADTFAAMLSVSVADVLAVVSAHPHFTVYAGYVFGDKATAVKKRSVRAHILASHLAPDAAPISQFTLWQEYRRRFQEIDACSCNDIRIALSDKRGAPHLFIVDNNNSLFALGVAATVHGLDLTPRFPDPEPEELDNTIGQIVNELRHGPATAEALSDRLDIDLTAAIPQLSQRSNIVSATPRYYAMADQASRLETMGWEQQDLVEEDALAIIGCRQACEDPMSVYLGWTPAYEQALCIKAKSNAWPCLPQLLWACEPGRWPLPEQEKASWQARKIAEQQPPHAVSLPSGSQLPDAERLLRFLLVIRQQGALSTVMANRVTRPRGPLQQINGTLIAMLVRVGALQYDADTYWSRHRAGLEAERWYSMLADEYLQTGELDWTRGACLAMVQEAVSHPGLGWAAAAEWTQRIRNWAAARGVDFGAADPEALQVTESDEARGAPAEGDDMDVASDLLPHNTEAAYADAPSADVARGDATEEAEELAKLASDVAADEREATVRSGSEAHAPSIESVAVLVSKAQSGDAEAQYHLARQLQEGIGAAPNLQAAAYWLQRAAEARHVPACVRLGRMLLKGEIGGGTRQERQQGLVYLNAGTKVGNATACYLVALAYRDGGLTRKNPQAAMRLLKRAAKAGHGKAAYALAIMLRERMTGWVPDTIKLLRSAASKGVHEAAELLWQVEAAR